MKHIDIDIYIVEVICTAILLLGMMASFAGAFLVHIGAI